jgi:hypothetical protein
MKDKLINERELIKMAKRYVEKLSKEELVKVFEANAKLREAVYGDMVDSEMFWIGEQLDYIKDSLQDWSIGVYNYNYISVKDIDGFIDGLIKMNKEVPLFEDTKQIFEVERMRDEFYIKDCYDEDYEEAEEKLDEAVKALAEEVVKQFEKRLNDCADNDNMLEYFLDFYYDARMESGSMYIQDDSYELYEDVSYTKSYK